MNVHLKSHFPAAIILNGGKRLFFQRHLSTPFPSHCLSYSNSRMTARSIFLSSFFALKLEWSVSFAMSMQKGDGIEGVFNFFWTN